MSEPVQIRQSDWHAGSRRHVAESNCTSCLNHEDTPHHRVHRKWQHNGFSPKPAILIDCGNGGNTPGVWNGLTKSAGWFRWSARHSNTTLADAEVLYAE